MAKPRHGIGPRIDVALGRAVVVWCGVVASSISMAHASRPQGGAFLVPAGRSPLQQRGEELRRPIPPRRLEQELRRAGEPAATISWEIARGYVGQVVTVEGKILKTGLYRSGKFGQICFLNFVEKRHDEFYIVIFEEALHGWPERPDRYFQGRTIRVTGRVTLHRKMRPQIVVRRPCQIRIVPPYAGSKRFDSGRGP